MSKKKQTKKNQIETIDVGVALCDRYGDLQETAHHLWMLWKASNDDGVAEDAYYQAQHAANQAYALFARYSDVQHRASAVLVDDGVGRIGVNVKVA